MQRHVICASIDIGKDSLIFFLDENEKASFIPDNIFDSYVQQKHTQTAQTSRSKDRSVISINLPQCRLKCEGFLVGESKLLNACALEEFDYCDGAYRSKTCSLNYKKSSRWCDQCSILKKHVGRHKLKYSPLSDIKQTRCSGFAIKNDLIGLR